MMCVAGASQLNVYAMSELMLLTDTGRFYQRSRITTRCGHSLERRPDSRESLGREEDFRSQLEIRESWHWR